MGEKNERKKNEKQKPYLFLRRPSHHFLHASPVVPRPVKDHDLARRRQVLQVPLPVPLRLLGLGGLGERDGPQAALVERGREPLDDAALAGGVAALEDDQDLEALVLDPELWGGVGGDGGDG